jgi:two-component system OmpR family response regulator
LETSQYICRGLQKEGYSVTAVDNGLEGLFQATTSLWDVIVLDRMLPGEIDGLATVRAMRDLGKTTPIIIVSALKNVEEKVSGLRVGADDYLTKPFALPELLARIEALVRRANPGSDPSLLQVGDLTLDLRANRVTRGGQVIALQPRDVRLLEYLMRNPNQVVTRAMLLKAVWNYNFNPQTNVIDVQISRLRNKVDRDRGAPLIHTIRGVGYRLSFEDPADHA